MTDPRIILTLDAGGTNFAFHAIRDREDMLAPIVLPSRGDDLGACLAALIEGFEHMKAAVGGAIHAISFAFPGPADYANGIIGDLHNLPAFRGGVALGPMLEDRFGVPVYINNDGDLFAYGEALCGILPDINAELEAAGSAKRFQNLLGLTIGTGFGAGIVTHGRLLVGDNGAAGEIWCTRNRLDNESYAEEGVSIRAVRCSYAEAVGLPSEDAPEPKVIAQIAAGLHPGDAAAARTAFARLGRVAGDAAANAATLVDGLVVIGGGLTGAHAHLLPAMVKEMNREFVSVTGRGTGPRMEAIAFNLEDQEQRFAFLRGQTTELIVPGSGRRVAYDSMKRVGVAISRLGAGRAVALGAYAYALDTLDKTVSRSSSPAQELKQGSALKNLLTACSAHS